MNDQRASSLPARVESSWRRHVRVARRWFLRLALAAGVAGVAYWLLPVSRILAESDWRLERVAAIPIPAASAEQACLSPDGRWLAVTSPDDCKLVVMGVDESYGVNLRSQVRLPGRPNAVTFLPTARAVLIAMSPNSDGPAYGWVEARDLDGRPVGSPISTGVRTDDVAIDPAGRFAVVICSGEYKPSGKTGDRGQPRLLVIDLRSSAHGMSVAGELEFMLKHQSPESVTVSNDGRWAALSMQRRSELALVNLADPAHPVLARNFTLNGDDHPDGLAFADDERLISADERSGSLSIIELTGRRRQLARCRLPTIWGRAPKPEEVAVVEIAARSVAVVTLARRGEVAVLDVTSQTTPRLVGLLAVRISWNPFAKSKPEGIATCAARQLIAVSDEDAAEVVLYRYKSTISRSFAAN